MGSTDSGTMRAAQYNKLTNKVEVNTIDIPTCGDDEILIQTKCATLCHSDLMLFWGHTREEPPTDLMTIGHENTGHVVAMGKNVTGFKIGDPVGCLGCSYACYDCEGCQIHNLFCEKGTGRMHGFTCPGHFAEYSLSHYCNAMVLPEGMDMITAGPLFCAGVTAYHSVKGCGIKEGDWIAIIGCGGLGHLAVQYAKAMGLKVVGIDISNNQLEAVKSLGADITCNSLQEKDYAQRIKKLTNGGCHAAAVFSASIAAYESAPNILRINGLLMFAGIPKKVVPVNALDILLGKYRIAGRSSGIPKNLPEAIWFSHDHNIRPHVTLFNSIDDIHKVIDLMEEGVSAGRFGIVFK